jgi:hypothetical protein
MAYVSISVEGGLFPIDLLERIASGDSTIPGQKLADFGIDGTKRLTDEIQSAFSDARSYWDAFQRRLGRSSESRTTITREDWMTGFLELLGFNKLVLQRSSLEVGNEKFFISHRAGSYDDATPIHIVSIEQELDHRESTGRRSPHGLVQDYLNRSNALWGIVTNGKELRLLRNIARLSKPTYLEFNIQGMIVGNLYSEFVLLYRLLHASRFPKENTNVHECLLERYYQRGIEEGDRVREKLRDGVEDALRILGTAFLVHPKSEGLRRKFQSGALTAPAYYRQLLRLVYRLLFLMVAEERKLIFPQSAAIEQSNIYTRYYSLTRLRERADRYFTGDQNIDLWLGISQTFYMFRDNDKAKLLGLSALNGELFSNTACADLEGATCTNDDLLKAIRELSTFRNDNGTRRRVNYAGLDVEEFGSVYESLLDYHPQVTLQPPAFDLVAGSERKQTGSYYTPPELVHELIESALAPVMQDRLNALKTREERERALLDLRVCDPASGSGHFLLAAARRIARELATIRSDGHEPSPHEYRRALRDVIRNCIYAVDKNPLAVDLCKVALWIEGHNSGLPLSFLDNHIKCGDSLVGVADLKALDQGIPDEAYQPVTGDDKEAATYYKKRNQEEKKRERQLFMGESRPIAKITDRLAGDFEVLGSLEERTPEEVNAKESLYNSLRRQDSEWWKLKVTCDLWTAAFFMPLKQEDALHMEGAPTTGTIRKHLETNSAHAVLVGQTVATSQEYCFFHWPLEFPDVFEKGGFDVVLGNPPWEQLQPQEIEFFGVYDQTIAKLAGSQRKKAIERLWETNPELASLWEGHIRVIEATTKFIRGCGRNRLTAHGKINTYSIFAETARRLIAEKGRLGMIVPSGIATDDATKEFFADLVDQCCLVSLLSFENEALVFPGIHHATKFCLLTVSGGGAKTEAADLVFFARRATDLQEEWRHFTLTSQDFKLINPNTVTCPIFRNQRDAEITRSIYQHVPVLINEKTGENPWALSLRQGFFNMTSDSHMFQNHSGPGLLPLYEAKMIHQFDHRFGTYEGQTEAQANQGKLPELTDEQHTQPNLTIMPRYWVTKNNVDIQISDKWDRQWFLVWRGITSAVTTRTVVCCIIPRVGVGNSLPAILLSEPFIALAGQLCANLCSFVLDYVARLKVGGTNLNLFIVSQLPLLPPGTYERTCPWSEGTRLTNWFAPRVLELTYTAWDLQPFAQDVGYDGSPFRWEPERRFLLRCELDSAFFHLYGMHSDDVDYIMDTFPLVKEKDEKACGEYRTKRVILEIYDEMAQSMRTGQPYQTRLSPPPADPRVAHNPPGR